jgi:quinol monooxygenase YgiN
MNRFSILGELIAADGKRDELAEILQDAEQLLLNKKIGCDVYSVNLSEEHPNSIFVFEIWTDEKSHQNSLQDEEVLALIMRGKPLITGMKRHYTFDSISKVS